MEDKKSSLQRRHFLLTLGTGGAAAAAAVVAVAGKSTPAAAPGMPSPGEPTGQHGISEHARNYYRTARI